jgi:hypothetical protein
MTAAKRSRQPRQRRRRAHRLEAGVCAFVLVVLGAPALAQGETDAELLWRYTPTLKYEADKPGDPWDGYYADSPATMTNNYRATGPPYRCEDGEGYSNALKRRGNPPATDPVKVLAAADPRAASQPRADCARLDLQFLGKRYDDGRRASPDFDFLDAHNDTYRDDAARMHLNPNLRNRVYGRAIRSGGRLWLQYWFFYYYNPQSVAGFGPHEGDWEMIELGFKRNDRPPFRAAYAQHNGHEVCPWRFVETSGPTSPKVYVANESHASYFSSGSSGRGPTRPEDDHHGDGETVGPNESDPAKQLTLQDISNPGPSWLRWPGRWGSIPGPKFQHSWSHPKEIAQSNTSGSNSCPGPAGRLNDFLDPTLEAD